MKKMKVLFVTTAIISMAICGSVSADVINCPTGSEVGATCWKCGDDCTAKLYNGKMTVSGTGDMYDYSKKEDVPWYSSRNSITSIEIGDDIERVGKRVFYDSNNLTSLKLGKSVESIGSSAFVHAAISDINIPSSVQKIEDSAFSNCCNRPLVTTNLTFEQGSNLTSIETSAFRDLGLSKVVMPDSQNLTVGDQLFAGTYITEIIMPAALSGASSAFRNMQASVQVYCSQDVIDANKCNSSYFGKSPLRVTHYERDENGNFVVYNNDGSIKGVYENGKNVFSDTIVDSYSITDSETGLVSTYDGRGQFLGSVLQLSDGSSYNFDANGNIIGMKKRGPYTIEEADAATKKGNVNKITITW